MGDFQSHELEPFARIVPFAVDQVGSLVASSMAAVVHLVASFDSVCPCADVVSLDMAVNCVAVD